MEEAPTPRTTDMARAEIVLTALAVVGCLTAGLLWRAFAPDVVSTWPWWTATAIATLALLVRVAVRSGRELLHGVLLVTVLVAVEAAAILTNDQLAQAERVFEPFQALKLLALAVAVVATPRRWFGVLAIASAAVIAPTQYATWPQAWVTDIPATGPYSTIVYAAIALVVYGYRLDATRFEREAARTQAEADSLLRFARLITGLLHLANTPLQTIASTADVLRMRHPEARELADRLQRASERLRELSRLAARYGRYGTWHPGDEALDAAALVDRELRALDRRETSETSPHGTRVFSAPATDTP